MRYAHEKRPETTAGEAASSQQHRSRRLQLKAMGGYDAQAAALSPHGVGMAEQALASANDRLPHADAIQRSFGPFDVSQVRSAVGGQAGQAAEALGARGFAGQGRVGFGAAPDLHTAAHEAAHVVQQRGGVQCKRDGDTGTWERHADAVADRVVQGKSAVDLLSRVASPDRRGAPGSVDGVQLKKADAPAGTGAKATRNGASGTPSKKKGSAMTSGKLDILKVDPYSYATWYNSTLMATAVWVIDDKGKRTPKWKVELEKLKRDKSVPQDFSRAGHCPAEWDSQFQGCNVNAVKRRLDRLLVNVDANGIVGGSLAPKPDGPIDKGTVTFIPVGPTGGKPPKMNRHNPGPGWLVLPKAQYEAEVAKLKARWLRQGH